MCLKNITRYNTIFTLLLDDSLIEKSVSLKKRKPDLMHFLPVNAVLSRVMYELLSTKLPQLHYLG